MEYTETTERPAYVRFDRVSIEDPSASAAQGRYVGRDVDLAMITPPGSRDIFKIEVPQWLDNMKQDVQNQRLRPEWFAQYKESYTRWKSGQEIPLTGTPIKGWGVISPAQQAALMTMMILTVEDLAAINDEAVHRIGMGAIDLRTKAKAWLSQMHDKGPLTIENAQLKQSLVTQQGELDTLKEQVKGLMAQLQASPTHALVSTPAELSIEDILTEEAPSRRGPGRPRKD